MASLKTKAPDVMCAAAVFHCNDTGRKPIQKIHKSMSLEAFAKHDCPCCVQTRKTANGLAQINSQNLDVHQMLLSPPAPATIAAVWREGSSSH
jgi:hypothetical protein